MTLSEMGGGEMPEFKEPGELAETEASEEVVKRPVFGHREVVRALLDGRIPFEGAITRTEQTPDGFVYTIEEHPGGEGKVETMTEADLLEINEQGE